MKIIAKIIPNGRPNRPGRGVRLLKITIHNTGNTSKTANAKAHGNYLINTNEKKSWHFTCDDKNTYQHLPTSEIGYHAKSGNSSSLGIEICENAGIDQIKANDNAAELTAYLLSKHNLTIEDVVTHKSWTNKKCPSLLLNGPNEGPKWEAFISRVSYFKSLKSKQEIQGLVSSSEMKLDPAIPADDLIDLDHSTIILS